MRFLARLRFYAEYAAFLLAAAIITAIPLDRISAASGRLWRAVAPRLKRQQRALDNLAIAFPEMSLAEREKIAAAMWENLGRTFAEFFHMPQILAEERVVLESLERFERVVEAGPFVVCTLHMGNWEVSSQVGLRFGLPLAGVYRQLSNPLVDRWVLRKRAAMYPGGLFDKSPATSRALLKLARAGGYPAFVADLREGRGVETPFFGRPAMSNPFPALIARVTGLPLYAARVKRLDGARFSMRIEPVEVPTTANRDSDVAAATSALQARFEEFIREAPEQWMWANRRWG